jgi:hypothetical protein
MLRVMCIFCSSLCYVNLFPCTSNCKELGVCCQHAGFILIIWQKKTSNFVACENLFFCRFLQNICAAFRCLLTRVLALPSSLLNASHCNLNSTEFVSLKSERNQTIDGNGNKGDKWTRVYEKLRRELNVFSIVSPCDEKKVKRNR